MLKPGDRLTLLVDERTDLLVKTAAPYGLAEALAHIEGIGENAERLSVVVVEVISAENALARADRDTLPAPAPDDGIGGVPV